MPSVPKARKPKWMTKGQHIDPSIAPPPQVQHTKVALINGVNVYKTYKHKQASIACRTANEYCQYCKEEGRSTIATLMDHAIPINRGGAIWDTRNHVSSCDECHNQKRQRESRGIIPAHMPNDDGDLIPYKE